MLTIAMAVFLGGNPAGLSDSLAVYRADVVEINHCYRRVEQPGGTIEAVKCFRQVIFWRQVSRVGPFGPAWRLEVAAFIMGECRGVRCKGGVQWNRGHLTLRVLAPQVIETYSDVDDDPKRLDRVLTPSANRVGCAEIGYPLETD